MVVELRGGICHTIDLCTLLLESECCYADPLVAAEVSQVKDRQEKLLLEKGGVMLRIYSGDAARQ